MPEFEAYWTSAIVDTATAKRVENGCSDRELILPKASVNTELVVTTESAEAPQLNRYVCGLRLKRSDENKASVEATMTAAGPP